MVMLKNVLALTVFLIGNVVSGQKNVENSKIEQPRFDPATVLWYNQPAKIWEDALPVGNGRLGATVYGKYG